MVDKNVNMMVLNSNLHVNIVSGHFQILFKKTKLFSKQQCQVWQQVYYERLIGNKTVLCILKSFNCTLFYSTQLLFLEYMAYKI